MANPGSAPQPAGNNEMPAEGQEEDRGSAVYYKDGMMVYDTWKEPEDAGRGFTSTKPDGQANVGPDQMDLKVESKDDGNLTSNFKNSGLDYTE